MMVLFAQYVTKRSGATFIKGLTVLISILTDHAVMTIKHPKKAFAQLYSSVTNRRITAAFAKNTLSDIINKDELNAVVTAYEEIEAAKAQQSDEVRYKTLVELNLGYIEKILSEQL